MYVILTQPSGEADRLRRHTESNGPKKHRAFGFHYTTASLPGINSFRPVKNGASLTSLFNGLR
jgi:hypothetical protein